MTVPRFQAQNPARSGDPFGWYACGPFSLAMGIDFDSGGTLQRTGLDVRKRTNDAKPKDGTNLDQLATAAGSLGIDLEVRRRMDLDDLLDRLEAGHAAVVGLSYAPIRHGENSGDRKFTGNHYVLLLPGLRVYDPLCDGRRDGIFDGPYTIDEPLLARATAAMVVDTHGNTVGAGRAYAGILPHRHLAVDAGPPQAPRPVNFRLGGGPHARGDYRAIVAAANVREDPHVTAGGSPADNIVGHLQRGQTFHCSQTTDTGQRVAGSRRWFGDRTGRRWVHSSVVTPV